MAAPTRIISLNLGMQTVCLAEFRPLPNGGLSLNAYKHVELMVDPATDATRPAQIEAAVNEARQALGLTVKELVHFCLPSQSVFTRFVKLPGATPQDLTSIIGFEAQQNVPFPIDEVVWDYQIMGNQREGNWDVVLVAIKADQLSEVNFSVVKAGFKTGTIDVAPMAIYNAFRYNYSELTGCSLIIDIGSRTTNLIFVENERAFSRSIPVGGNTITSAVAKEFNQDIGVAEKLKIEKGFVGLGGAYAEPNDPTEAKVSKVIRNTMTRLHAEIARSISFYRANQGGSQPVRVYLCGGTVSLPYMFEFFSEKLQLPIEFLNPLKNITVSSQSTAAALSDKAHTLCELVGSALRSFGNCPVEINLRPPSVVREQGMARRKPYLVMAASCLILALASWWLYYFQAASLTQQMLDSVKAESNNLDQVAQQIDSTLAEQKKFESEIAPILTATAERVAWSEILDELGSKLPKRFIWITEIKPTTSAPPAAGTTVSGPPAITSLDITGLYLDNPPNELEAKIIDQYVDNLQKSSVFAIEDKSRVVTQRVTPTGDKWAYEYSLKLPLRKPIPLP